GATMKVLYFRQPLLPRHRDLLFHRTYKLEFRLCTALLEIRRIEISWRCAIGLDSFEDPRSVSRWTRIHFNRRRSYSRGYAVYEFALRRIESPLIVNKASEALDQSVFIALRVQEIENLLVGHKFPILGPHIGDKRIIPRFVEFPSQLQ